MSHTGVPKGSTCTFGKFECALGLMCEGSWRQTGNEGVCHCDRLFGFHGPECSELSFTTYMLVACALAPLILAVFVFSKSARHIVHFYANAPRGLYLTAGGRAILCTTTCAIAECFETVGLILHALRMDRAIFFVKYVMVPTHGLIIAAFVGATLSVSAVWLQMIEKARIDKLKKTQVYLYPGLAVSSFATFGLIAVVSAWVYLRSNSMFPILGALFQMVLSLSFRVAGQRVNALLDIVLDTRDEVGASTLSLTVVDKTRAISEKIKRTTAFMTWSSGVLCVLFVVSALTFPAQVPLYPSQNNLPRCMSGQVAAALTGFGLLIVINFIVEYVTFWDIRHSSGRDGRASLKPLQVVPEESLPLPSSSWPSLEITEVESNSQHDQNHSQHLSAIVEERAPIYRHHQQFQQLCLPRKGA